MRGGLVQISAATRPSPPERKPRQPRRLFSARLKSMPVETSARSVLGLRATPRSTLAQIDVAVRLDRPHRQRRQGTAGGIADDAQGRERQAGLGGVGCGNMALHIDGRRPGFRAQRRLAGASGDHLLDAGEATPDHPPAAERDARDPFLVQSEPGQPAGIAGQHLGGDDDIARSERGIEPTGDAEADDAPDRRGVKHRQKCPQLLRIAAAADHGHARPGRDSGLLHQTSHNQHRPRVK